MAALHVGSLARCLPPGSQRASHALPGWLTRSLGRSHQGDSFCGDPHEQFMNIVDISIQGTDRDGNLPTPKGTTEISFALAKQPTTPCIVHKRITLRSCGQISTELLAGGEKISYARAQKRPTVVSRTKDVHSCTVEVQESRRAKEIQRPQTFFI